MNTSPLTTLKTINQYCFCKTFYKALFVTTLMLTNSFTFAAALVSVATEPLVNSVPPLALPNLMYVLDNSGSMTWEHTPDWVADSHCKLAPGIYNSNCGYPDDPKYTAGRQLPDGAPPYRSPDFNNQYYNPAIKYTPAVKADKTSYLNQTTTADNDAYNIQQTGTTDLLTKFSDIEWCTSSAFTDCLRNDNYVLPGTVNGKAYTFKNKTFATGTKTLAKGVLATDLAAKTLGPHYYKIIPGEYCDTAKLKNCQALQTAVFQFPAKVRWCDSKALTNCQSLKTGAYEYARYPTVVNSLSYSAIAIGSQNNNSNVSGITVGGKQLMSGTSITNAVSATLAAGIATRINACTAAVTGNCTIAGYSASSTADSNSTAILYIYAPAAGAAKPIITSAGPKTFVPSAFTAISTQAVPGSFQRIDIVNELGKVYPKSAARTDCVAAAASCSYNEEIINFANWYSFYRSRMQMMKTSTSIAFKNIEDKYRIGFVTINMKQYLPINKFISGSGKQKDTWYTRLFAANPADGTGTMLRSALANVGRIYAGKNPISGFTADPMQYSCQQNYTLLTTDGYWNVDTDTDIKNIAGNGQPGNQDAAADNKAPISEGPIANSNSLADVARYYYNTDLRDGDNCTGGTRPDGTTGDVCANNVFTSPNDEKDQQHMTTFTLGLGVDGSLAYTSDYKDATSGDYYDLSNGVAGAQWPTPVEETESAIDDLWHAAVNGNGTYFSAKDPAQLSSSLTKTLTEIGSTVGAAAAAATSTLNPVAGDNLAFLATYTTAEWTGNIEAREINTETGRINVQAKWCAEDIGADTCGKGQSAFTDTSGTVTAKYCVTANSTQTACDSEGGTLVGTDCRTGVATSSCTGTMTQAVRDSSATIKSSAVVADVTDNRTIYFSGVDNLKVVKLMAFNEANLTLASKQGFFKSTDTTNPLSQWPTLSTAQQTLLTAGNLINYLRGQTGYDDRLNNVVAGVDNRLFRKREAILGDVLESTPAYIGKTTSKYLDPGYAKFKTDKAARDGVVYVAANDGMLHAFDATTVAANAGKERWAFVPTAVLPDMYKLADKNYSANHRNFLNGDIYISDICTDSCTDNANAVWKTILVAGQNGGGKSYYALDITDPVTPKLLWEFSNSVIYDSNVTTNGLATAPDLGLTFGAPIVTKNASGEWVVLLTSGYNNAKGKGHLYVLNADTGKVISDYETSAGTAASPSGLAKISAYAINVETDNTTTYAYGGDLEGNLWRFDLTAAPSTSNPFLFATLKAGSVAQPITTAPEIGIINDTRVVFVGTGKYLEPTDLDDKTSQQSIYAIKDNNETSTLVNPREQTSIMVKQTINQTTNNRSTSTVDVPTSKRGWFIDLKDPGERQNVNPQLVLGTLQFVTIVPTAGACSPGGYGWFNYVDYETGGSVAGASTGERLSSPGVGLDTLYINGVPKTSLVDSKGDIKLITKVPFKQTITGFQKKRVIWRELLDPEQ